ncbi:MAG: hypothetical protein [Circular genetic element sp.]|nr:MAG: hypothetical protein [Circular genetic element sp.]
MEVVRMSTRTDVNNPRAQRPVHKAPPRACGCKKERLCKHLYANLRSQRSADADRHTTEETGGGLLGGPHQTYFDIGLHGVRIVGPNETHPHLRRSYRFLNRKAKRL